MKQTKLYAYVPGSGTYDVLIEEGHKAWYFTFTKALKKIPAVKRYNISKSAHATLEGAYKAVIEELQELKFI